MDLLRGMKGLGPFGADMQGFQHLAGETQTPPKYSGKSAEVFNLASPSRDMLGAASLSSPRRTPKGQLPVQPELPEPLPEEPLAVVNKLHQVLSGAGLHADLGLPQIAVVGSQSVGKTSVLEALVGRDFLPRGSGIVTRRPLVLQLKATASPAEEKGGEAKQDAAVEEWAEFEHKAGERFTCFKKVRAEIEQETNRLCGENRGVSSVPILLRIFSPAVTDLTLVDLPGLTKVPTGDQPSDIAEQIRALLLRYVSHRSCLILAVSAANTDLATSDALALAREVDPHGERTLGVITKLDLADESGGALEALQGRVYPLRLGYIGLVCRNELATKAGLDFESALAFEAQFLQKSPGFAAVADSCGTPHLARRLHELLLAHVRETLPNLRASVQCLADRCRQELASLGDLGLEAKMGPGPFLLNVISGYSRNFSDALEGRLAYSEQEAPPDRLVGGARLHFIFHKIFAQAVLDFDPLSGLTDLEVRVAMRNAAGPKPQLFVPEVAFEALVKRQIQKLEDPCLQCVQMVYEELKSLAIMAEVDEMQRFPGLRERVLEVAHGLTKRCVQPTSQMVSNLIHIELAHINVDHPDFIGGLRAMYGVQQESAAFHDATASLEKVAERLTPRLSAAQSAAQWASAPSSGRAGGAEASAHVTGARGMQDMFGRKRSNSAHGAAAEEPLWLPAVPLVVAPSGEPSEKERMDTELLKSLVASYFSIVKRKIVDSVPKAIMRFMANTVRDSVHHECVAELYKTELFASLLQEAEDVQRSRQQCERTLAELRCAQDILARVCDAAINA